MYKYQPFDFQAGVHARIQIYWCRSSIFRHLKLELLTQFPASNDEKYINVVYIWRKFVSFYGYVYWRMTTEISVMYGSEKVNTENILFCGRRLYPYMLPIFHSSHAVCICIIPDCNHTQHSTLSLSMGYHSAHDCDHRWLIRNDISNTKRSIAVAPPMLRRAVRKHRRALAMDWR